MNMTLLDEREVYISIEMLYQDFILIPSPWKVWDREKGYYLNYPILSYKQCFIDNGEGETIMEVLKICHSLEDCLMWLHDYFRDMEDDSYEIDYISPKINDRLKEILS